MTMVMTGHKGFAPMTRVIKASEFKAKCLALIDQVANTGDPIVIAKNGKPLVELIAHRTSKRSPLGVWKGEVAIKADIISPIDVDWEALKWSCSTLTRLFGWRAMIQPLVKKAAL
jgi:prevent-host-death family protein